MSILNLLEKARDRAFQPADHDTIGEARNLIAEIHAKLDGVEWNSDTTNDIAELLARHGLPAGAYDPDEESEEEKFAKNLGWASFEDSEDPDLLVVANEGRSVHFTGEEAWKEAAEWEKKKGD